MLLKDRVMLITNVEKFAGHGTTRGGVGPGRDGSGARSLLSRRRAPGTSTRASSPAPMPCPATEPATLVELALKRHGHIDALVNNDAYPALRAPLAEARLEDFRAALEAMAVAPLPPHAARGAVDAQAQVGPHRVRLVGRTAARHRQLCAVCLGARGRQRPRLLAGQGAGTRRHHGERRRLELCREPRLLPAGACSPTRKRWPR